MQKLILIKKINLIKTIDYIDTQQFNFENKYNMYMNTIRPNEYLNGNMAMTFSYKNNNIIFDLKKIFRNNIWDTIFIDYINTIEKTDNFTLRYFKSMQLNKYYSSYNLNLLYTLALKDVIIAKILASKNNLNKVLNIRTEFKASNYKVLRKLTVFDIILKKYLESCLCEKISMNFDKYSIGFFRRRVLYIKVIRRKLRRMRKMLNWAKISLRNFIRITLIFLCTKDIDIFAKVLEKIMNSMHYKNHRRFLYYLKLFITKSMHYFFNILKFEGFFFYLSGKISGGGNSKKKNYAIRSGKYSLTTKMLKLKFKKGLIHTKTGVLGYKFMISYR